MLTDRQTDRQISNVRLATLIVFEKVNLKQSVAFDATQLLFCIWKPGCL